MIKWDKIWHFKHVWSNLSNLKKKSSPPSIALSIQKQEVNLVLPWICKVNYPKRSSYIMRDKLIIRSNFYTNWYQFQDFIGVVQLTQSLSPQVCAGGYLHHQVQLIDHAKPMPKGNQRLKTMISASITELKFTLKCNWELSRYSDMGQCRPTPIFSCHT